MKMCTPNVRALAASLSVLLTLTCPPLATRAATPSPSPQAQDFDHGTGTGQPNSGVAHLLQLMKKADDGFNARDYPVFLDQLHSAQVEVHQFAAPVTVGRPTHKADMEMWVGAFPDMRVHNDPYDVQFGQGDWTVAMGKLSGTFTQPLRLPDGTVVQPTGKAFTTFFTTIAKWKNDQLLVEYVLMDQGDIMKQIGVKP